MLRIIFSMLFFLLSGSQAFSEVYKWVDENGKVHYSDKKLKKSSKKVEIKETSTTKSHESDSAEQRLERQKEYLEYRQEEREKKKKQKEIKKQEKAKINRYCNRLRDELESMTQEYAIWYDLDEETGERKYLTDEELEQRIEETREVINSNCS